MANFDQYLNDYMNIKRLRGITPSQKASEAVFNPYFDRQFNTEMAGRKQVLAEQELATRTGQQGEALSWDKTKTMNELAGQKDITLSRLASEKDITTNRLAAAKDISMAELAGEKDITLNKLAAQKDITTADLGWDKEKFLTTLAAQKELQARQLSWEKEKILGNLALDHWKQGLLIDQAGRSDTKATIGNALNTVGSLGSMYAMKQYMPKRH